MIVGWIDHTPGVVGGRAHIRGTRMPVWTLAAYWKRGVSDAVILGDYPQLTVEQLEAARIYYDTNREEIERDIADQENA